MTTIEEVEKHFRVKAALLGVDFNAPWFSSQLCIEALTEYNSWSKRIVHYVMYDSTRFKKICELYLKYHPEE